MKFKYALEGIYTCLQDKSIRIQCLLGLVTILFFSFFHLEWIEWMWIIACVGMVIVLEIINICIERICDVYTKEQDERIKKIKDMSAGMVLIGCILSAIIGISILIRKLGG